ncbi:Hypothetical protein CINCED_3A017407 [Cinara cedri]|uniref:Uncharacterized protein n=1 Tax=Cinara cedri TaxID=506608 RepID=A0A5E4NRX4_9HEMI|nr:Hypothetical protein CINCED_3A017407 [Cinara cedri]
MGHDDDTDNDERLRLYLTFMETPAEVTRRNWMGQANNDPATVTQSAVREWYEKYIQPSDGGDDEAPAIGVEDLMSIFECNSLRKPDRPVNSATIALINRSLFEGLEFHESTRAFCEFLNGRPDLEKPTYLVELGMFEDAETYEKKRKLYKKK